MRIRRASTGQPGSPPAAERSGRHAAGSRSLVRSVGGAALAIVVVLAGIAVTNLVGGPSAAPTPTAGVAPLTLPAAPTSAAGSAGAALADASVTASATPVGDGARIVPAATAAPTPSATASPVPALVVLNDSRITGLAARAAGILRAAGWPVARIGNLPARVPETTVFYDPGQQEQAARLVAAGLGVRAALPRGSWLPDSAPLVVVVTRDFPPA